MTDQPSPAPASQTGEDYVVVARRYRPQTFGELIGQGHVAKALEQAIRSGRIGHAYLFTGARGVGKTSAARILAKALNCVEGPTPTPCGVCDICRSVASGDDVDVLEIDGASNRGIDEIRQLRQNAGVRPSRARMKVYIIDEVHMLTKEAFNALLKTLEEPPEHVKFIFATTEPNKIPITILSRCQRFDFAGIEAVSIGERLSQIAQAEGVAIDDEALQTLAVRAAGSMRDSQSLLEQLLAVVNERITVDDVNSLLGIAPAARVAELAERLADRDAAGALALLDAAITGGADAGQLIDQLMGYYRDVMALAVGCPPERMLYALPAQHEAAGALGGRLGVNTLLAVLQVLDQTAARLRVSVHERTLADMAIVRIASLENLDDLSQTIADLQANPSLAVAPTAPVASPATASPTVAPAATVANKPANEPVNGHTNGAESIPKGAIPKRPATEPPVAQQPVASSEEPEAGGLLDRFAQMQKEAPAPSAASANRPATRRQQQAEAAQQPFVARAMELFDVEPDKLRYTPPKNDRNAPPA